MAAPHHPKGMDNREDTLPKDNITKDTLHRSSHLMDNNLIVHTHSNRDILHLNSRLMVHLHPVNTHHSSTGDLHNSRHMASLLSSSEHLKRRMELHHLNPTVLLESFPLLRLLGMYPGK